MDKWITVTLIVFSMHLHGQSKEELTGLWLVTNVQVGDQEMTPDAKWTRLNPDFTQESGNGWFQHSVGTWSFEGEKLSVISTNGIIDRYGGFEVDLQGDRMICKRMEEGDQVVVTFERIDKLPQTRRDQLMGIWKPVEVEGSKDLLNIDPSGSDYLFIRWDGKFVVSKSGARTFGVYSAHAHRSEIELIPYGEDMDRSFWSVELKEEVFEMTLLGSQEEVKRRFIRVREFPE